MSADAPLPEGAIPLRERRSLADSWSDFERQVLPAGSGQVQRVETKRAYYAGAAALFGILSSDLDADKEPTDLDLAFVESVYQELRVFANRLAMGLE